VKTQVRSPAEAKQGTIGTVGIEYLDSDWWGRSGDTNPDFGFDAGSLVGE